MERHTSRRSTGAESERALAGDGVESLRRPPSVLRALHAYAAGIIGAEIVGATAGIVPGALCHTLLAIALVNHYLISTARGHETTTDPEARRGVEALLILSLLPLLRLLSLIMPLRFTPQLIWYPLIGVPSLIATGLAVRLLRWSPDAIGVTPRLPLVQCAIALSGVPLGLGGFLLFRPPPMIDRPSWSAVLIAALILLIFAGFFEEFIYRGLVQSALRRALGPPGLVWGALLFASAYLGSYSPGYVLFIGAVGIYFGLCVDRTGSIWGVILAHAGLTISMLLVFPLVWR